MEEHQSITCASCESPYHEATGHRLSDRTVICGACARNFLKWWKGMMSRRWGGVKFYDHAFTSVKPKEEEK